MKILLIEDELEIAVSIKSYLTAKDIICESAMSLQSAMEKILSFDYDCILLDLSLPDGNGFEILKKIKQQRKTDGIIIISAKETLDTRIEGISLGADDYLIKPFHLSELLVRIQAVVRRKKFDGNNVVIFEEIELDIFSKTVKIKNVKTEFTKKEIDLLLFLIGNANKVVSKGSIAENLSGDMADMLDNHDFVYAHIKNLRKKLIEAGSNDYIKSVYGIGYKWHYD